MFEFLFKYSPIVFSEGKVAFNYQPSVLIIILALLAFFICLWIIYRKTTLELSRIFKNSLMALKLITIFLLLFLLLEPIVTVSTIMPRKSSLILLVDDSKSMSIKDVANKSRKDFTQRLLGSEDVPGIVDKLKKNFRLQMYKFSGDVSHLQNPAELAANGDLTDLAAGLNFAADISKQTAVSGIVVITDGVDNGSGDPLEVAARMKNSKLPLFMIGIGSETTKDVRIAKVTTNHSVIENSVIELSAIIKNKNQKDQQIELELKEQGRVIKRQTVQLKGSATRVSMSFSPQRKRFARYSLEAIAKEKEAIEVNNIQSFLIDNRKKKSRVLYIEGYPRTEFKFIRRAFWGDESIQLVSLLRTGPDKFYRQGIKDQQELKEGFPTTKEELFKYDAVILGSIERDFFTDQQLANLVDFVSIRGGGFLMIGGVHSFSQGGYTDSDITKMLPTELIQSDWDTPTHTTTLRDKYKLLLTSDGYKTPFMQLASVESENHEMWENLADLEGYNPLGRAKPGATVLAVHPLSELLNPKIILAQQRFGRGRTMVFATSSSWHWQMGMPHENTSHERFWRQIIRYLALESPQPVTGGADKEIYVPNEQVKMHMEVRDSAYIHIRDATVSVRVKTPGGQTRNIPFTWSSGGNVEFSGEFKPTVEGMHQVTFSAYNAKGEFIGKTETAFFVEESRVEFANAHLQSKFLKRMADISGGKYFHQTEAENLPDEISVMQSNYSKLVEYDLWDMPVFFLLVIGLLAIEWYVRRSRGLS